MYQFQLTIGKTSPPPPFLEGSDDWCQVDWLWDVLGNLLVLGLGQNRKGCSSTFWSWGQFSSSLALVGTASQSLPSRHCSFHLVCWQNSKWKNSFDSGVGLAQKNMVFIHHKHGSIQPLGPSVLTWPSITKPDLLFFCTVAAFTRMAVEASILRDRVVSDYAIPTLGRWFQGDLAQDLEILYCFLFLFFGPYLGVPQSWTWFVTW